MAGASPSVGQDDRVYLYCRFLPGFTKSCPWDAFEGSIDQDIRKLDESDSDPVLLALEGAIERGLRDRPQIVRRQKIEHEHFLNAALAQSRHIRGPFRQPKNDRLKAPASDVDYFAKHSERDRRIMENAKVLGWHVGHTRFKKTPSEMPEYWGPRLWSRRLWMMTVVDEGVAEELVNNALKEFPACTLDVPTDWDLLLSERLANPRLGFMHANCVDFAAKRWIENKIRWLGSAQDLDPIAFVLQRLLLKLRPLADQVARAKAALASPAFSDEVLNAESLTVDSAEPGGIRTTTARADGGQASSLKKPRRIFTADERTEFEKHGEKYIDANPFAKREGVAAYLTKRVTEISPSSVSNLKCWMNRTHKRIAGGAIPRGKKLGYEIAMEKKAYSDWDRAEADPELADLIKQQQSEGRYEAIPPRSMN